MPKYIDADALRKRMEQIAEESKPAATARPMREDTPSELLRYGTARAMIEWLDEIPAADVEPVRHGRWINHTEPDQNNNIMCWCSECGAGDQHAVGVEVPYCWKCGAKMQDSTRGKLVGEALDRIISEYMQSKEVDNGNKL